MMKLTKNSATSKPLSKATSKTVGRNRASFIWWAQISQLIKHEARLRLRRASTLATLLVVMAISWTLIPDPNSDMTLMTINNARALYTSSTLALGSAALASILFGFGGFFLVRGRVAEDLRCGLGAVIATTPMQNGCMIFSRWLGGVAYLTLLVLGLLCTTLVCHALRGEGPIQILVYLQTYAFLLLPLIFFSAACAVLFDSVPILMGKFGDFMFFLIWTTQIGMMTAFEMASKGATPAFLVLDFFGVASSLAGLGEQFHTTSISLGMTDFNAQLAPIRIPDFLWSASMINLRFGAALLALSPLLPAAYFFHRYSPDRVATTRARPRRSPLTVVNRCLRPLAKCAQPIMQWGMAHPHHAGQIAAEVALTLMSAPFAILVILVNAIASLICPLQALPTVLGLAFAFWGILISDIATRDYQFQLEKLTTSVRDGAIGQLSRQLCTNLILAGLFMGSIFIRWLIHEPLRALALITGVICISAIADLLGRCVKTPRLFLALFLFGLYVALNVRNLSLIDIVGFNGVANSTSTVFYFALSVVTLIGNFAFSRWKHT
jgi:hypothetical protein